jgi:phosphoesterase RecJ-like protein
LESVGGLNREIGTCLMTGLVTDTGGFTNLATTASSIDTASDLLGKGVNLRSITKRTLQNRSVATLHLWGRALERLSTHSSGLITTGITKKDMDECGANHAAIEGVANFLNTIDTAVAAKGVMVLAEPEDGLIKGSLRTTHPLIDVSKLATLLGGGGHKKAAGFSLPGHLHYADGRWQITPLN